MVRRLCVMQFFCIRTKPRHTGKKRHNKKTATDEKVPSHKKFEEEKRPSSVVHIESRRRSESTRRKKNSSETTTRRKSGAMSSHRPKYYPDLRPGDNREQQRTAPGCACCCHLQSQYTPPSSRNVSREQTGDVNHRHYPEGRADQAHDNLIPLTTRVPSKHSQDHQKGRRESGGADGHTPCKHQSQHQQRHEDSAFIDQIYVHPYTTHHYRFPVVDHSFTTSHGVRAAASFPACYMAQVPESATVQDIEAALAHRPGLAVMVRLLATEELVPIGTFRCTKDLHQASLQLEMLDEGEDRISPKGANGGHA